MGGRNRKYLGCLTAALICLGLLYLGPQRAEAQRAVMKKLSVPEPTVVTVTLGKTQKVLIPGRYPKTNARLVTVPARRGEGPQAIKGMEVTIGDMDRGRTGRYFTFVTSAKKPASPGIYQLEYYDGRSKKWLSVPLNEVKVVIVAESPKSFTKPGKGITPLVKGVAPQTGTQEAQGSQETGEAQGPQESEEAQGPQGPDLVLESCEIRCNRGGGYSTEVCDQYGYRDDFLYLVIANLTNEGDEAASIESGWKVWSATHQRGNSAPVPVGWAAAQEAAAGGIYLTPGTELTGGNRPAVTGLSDLLAGTHRIVITADPDNKIAETDENNNTSECVWEVVSLPPPPPFDLAVTNVSVSPQSGPPGTDFQFTVTVKNIGGAYFDVLNTTCQPGTGFNKQYLEENESVTRTYTIPGTMTPGEKTITCAVTAFKPEENKSNNSMSATFSVTAP